MLFSVVVLEYWSIGVLECWSVGVLGCWGVVRYRPAQHGGQAGLPAVPPGKVFIFHGFWASLAVSKRAATYLYVMHRPNGY